LNRLQSRTASDLESIRLNQREAFEREIAGLKESRDRLASEFEKQHSTLSGLKEDYTALQEEARRLQSQLETERTDTRNALKLKQFEYDRLSLTYEELLSDMRKLKIEHELLTKKHGVLKNEFYALQGQTQKDSQDLENQNRNLTEKLSMYQQLEYELDMAILNAGGLEDVKNKDELTGHGGGGGQIRGIHSLLESLGSNIPTANKRRMKQSILLAQQLVEKQKRIEVLTAELTHYKDRNQELEVELQASKHALEYTSQPHNYLIQALQAKEGELAEASRKSMQLGRDLAARDEELRRCIETKTNLEADLHRLIQGKQHLDGIKQALIGNQNKFQTGASILDQQYAAQQGMSMGAIAAKENRPPQQQQYQQPPRMPYMQNAAVDHASLNDPRAHMAHMQMHASSMSMPPQHFAAHSASAVATAASLASSQGRPTSSIPAHNQASAQNRYTNQQQQQSGDSNIDAQPKPLWFRKLTQ
jgi:chromosome segregation ATPase